MCTELLIMYKPFRLAHSPHNNPLVRQTPRTQSDCECPCRYDPKRAYTFILTSLPPESFWTVEMPSIHFPNAYVRSCYLNRFLSLSNNDASVACRCASQMSIKKLFFPKKYSPKRSCEKLSQPPPFIMRNRSRGKYADFAMLWPV